MVLAAAEEDGEKCVLTPRTTGLSNINHPWRIYAQNFATLIVPVDNQPRIRTRPTQRKAIKALFFEYIVEEEKRNGWNGVLNSGCPDYRFRKHYRAEEIPDSGSLNALLEDEEELAG